MKKECIKQILISFVMILSILIAVLCFHGCSCAKIDLMNYKGHSYSPAPGFEAISVKWPIGIDNGYVMYALKNDPEIKFMDPQNGLKRPRYLVVRDDVVLPHISKDAIARIAIESKSGKMMDVSQEAKEYFIDLLQTEDISTSCNTSYSRAYQVRIYFVGFPQIYFVTWMYQLGTSYTLLLENGETVTILDKGVLAELGFCDDVSRGRFS